MPTTTDLLPQIDDIRSLESKLQQQKAPHQRLILLDRLLSYYTYTNPQRAKTFLSEQAALIKSHPNPDVELNFHLYSAIGRESIVQLFQLFGAFQIVARFGRRMWGCKATSGSLH